jgi:hypothetical protein
LQLAIRCYPCRLWVIFVRSTRSRRSRHVRFAPIASELSHRSESTRCANRVVAHRSKKAPLLDHLVGASEHRWRHIEAKRPRGLEIDDQFVLGRRLYRQVGWLLTLENAIDVGGGAAVLVD